MTQLMKLSGLLFALCCLTQSSPAQSLSGVVIDAQSRQVIPAVHVINKSTLKGSMSDQNGRFKISLSLGDTIVFSNIAYKYLYFIYQDSSSNLSNVLVELKEQNYLLEEASIFSYKLTSNSPREMVLEDPATPDNSELSDGRLVRAGVNNPAEYLYNLFGSKPRQLRELAKLKELEKYRDKLEQSNNRQNVIAITGLSQEELEAFMFYCKFAPVRMQTLNDYEFLLSVQHCFHLYVKERELENFLRQFD